MLTRDACCEQVLRDTTFDAIVLNPNFAIIIQTTKFEMQDDIVDALIVVPSYIEQLILIMRLIKEHLDLNIAIGWLELCVMSNHIFYDLTIAIYSTHCTIASFA